MILLNLENLYESLYDALNQVGRDKTYTVKIPVHEDMEVYMHNALLILGMFGCSFSLTLFFILHQLYLFSITSPLEEKSMSILGLGIIESNAAFTKTSGKNGFSWGLLPTR